MDQFLTTVCHDLLDPAGLSEFELQKVLSGLTGRGIDYADLYFQASCSENWAMEESIIKGGGFSVDKGVGVRAISGEKTGFSYSDDLYLPALKQAAEAARAIGHGQGSGGNAVTIRPTVQPHHIYPDINPLQSITELQKVAILQEVDACARSLDPRVVRVSASLAAEYESVLVMASDGHLAADIRPLVRLSVSVVVEQNGRREQGGSGGGGRYSYQYLLDNNLGILWAKEAVAQALLNLEAVEAPAGSMPVVLGPGWPGVLLHEAVGHGLEGDFNRKGTSLFAGRLGQQVISPLCTIVDDATLPNRRGSLNIDDEGVPAQCTVLIEDGILRGYMQDKMNARLMGTQSTGNGRRESYACVPMPRMTNTYMRPGQSTPEEIIASVKKGIYAVNFGGGQVDITSGKFVFSANEAWLIENGRLVTPVKGATLTGIGPEVLKKISMVGNDLKLDSGVGTCGKDGQSVPVGVGQPTLKVDGMVVGGTKVE